MTKAVMDELRAALERDASVFGPTLAQLAADRGLAVTKKEDGSIKPIPITATPVVIERAELIRRQRLAALLSSAGLKMSRAVLNGLKREVVFNGLSPLEQQLADKTFRQLDTLVTTRVDFFVGDAVRALEINATIPAMQAYSDIAANTFLEVVGRHWGATEAQVASWKTQNGSNAKALFDALMAGYAKFRPGKKPARMVLLSRRNDAQLTEQRSLCSRFNELGVEAEVVHPDQLSGSDTVLVNGKPVDLIYRHLFVRRLEETDLPGAEYVKALLAEPNGTRAVILNPPASQVEVKAVFGLMSEAIEDAAIAKAAGLTDDELEAIRTSVPWTRLFRGDALLAEVQQNPDRYVLKRSWDYGGRAVFVGRTSGESSFSERVKAAYGEALDWKATCARAISDPTGGGFVVQQVVDTLPERHLLCAGQTQSWADLFVDYSSYASVGLPEQPAWGGVCRGSISHIVNIVGGGGVLPLLVDEVAAQLHAAATRRVK
ncbi:MAG: hypothetical protein Q8L14_40340 [Myxococcales bacterium]|nr:hypothetical protein [Myxococcales bacterium]